MSESQEVVALSIFVKNVLGRKLNVTVAHPRVFTAELMDLADDSRSTVWLAPQSRHAFDMKLEGDT